MLYFCTFSNFIPKDMLRLSNMTETLLIVRSEGSNSFGKYLFVCVSIFFNNNKNEKKISRAILNKFLLREIKDFKCPNIVPPQIGQLQVCFVCLFVFFCSILFFPKHSCRGKRKRQTQMTQSS